MQPGARIFNQHIILILALVLTIAVYFKFFFYGHLSWDDPEMVFRNRDVKSFDVASFFKNQYVGNYIPLTMIFHALGFALFKNAEWGHHLLSVLFHLFNGILVYIFVSELSKQKLLAAFCASVFLLHPLQIEPVGWIGELKTPVYACFFLGSMIQYLHYKKSGRQKHFLFCAFLFILSCLSKPSAVVLPLCLVAIDLYVDGKAGRKQIFNKIPLFAISVLFGIINLKTQSAGQFINYAHAFPWGERFGYAGFAMAKYLQHFIFPFRLSVLYPYPSDKEVALLIGFSVLTSLVILLYLLFKKKKFTYLSLVLLILINLVLVLQFIPFGEVLYADRYMYLPLLFFALLAGEILIKQNVNQRLVVCASLAVFSVISFFRAGIWQNGVTLYGDILKKFPDSFVALNSLGVEHMFRNEDVKALGYLNEAARIAPRNYKSFYNRGLLYLKMNRPKEAVESFNKALNLYDYTKALTGRASAYYMLNDIPKAMADVEKVLAREPGNIKAKFIRGNIYNELGKPDEAIKDYNECVKADSENPDFYFKRAIAFGKNREFEKCLSDLNICLELNPVYFEAYYWRGIAKLNMKTNPCADFEIAARNRINAAAELLTRFCGVQ